MDASVATRSIDRLIAEVAERQHGVVEHGQLVALGLGRGAIAHRIAAGRLHRIHVGVYAVGHARLSASGRRMAAVLACGRGAVLSHQTAADLWGIRPSASPALHVTVPSLNGRRRPGIRLHRTRSLPPAEITRRDGIPVTTVARTLLDLAGVVDRASLRNTVERAEKLRLFDLRHILAAVEAHPGRPTAALRGALAEAGFAPTRSDLESDFLALCRRHGLPQPEVNVPVGEYEIDALWRDAGLAVEVDSWMHHGTRRAFERDRRRDVELALRGITVARYTHARIVGRPGEVAAELRALLGRAVATRAPL